MPTADVSVEESTSEFELIYDTLEAVPSKSGELESSLWKPPDRNSLVPVISIVC